MIESVINILKDDSEIGSEVGENKAGSTVKVFPVVCPQGEEMPYIICAITGCQEKECKDASGYPHDEIFDVIAYAKNYADVDVIGKRIIDIITNFSGNSGSSYVSEFLLQTHKDLFDNDRQAYVRLHSFKSSGFLLSELITAFTTGFSIGFRA